MVSISHQLTGGSVDRSLALLLRTLREGRKNKRESKFLCCVYVVFSIYAYTIIQRPYSQESQEADVH